jgi:peptidoglycan/LPS O-acetylase OafA/YrhL
VEDSVIEKEDSYRSYRISFRPDIEGLRAIAVMLVVLYHAGLPHFTGGLIGVDIFFVISGYLITSLLSREADISGGINLVRFYARRARRLLPAATVVVVVVCLTEAILASPLVQYRVLKDAAATMAYSSNIYFSHMKRSYFFPGVPPSPLIHAWSLAVEEQFYIIWPLILLSFVRLRASVKGRVLFLALLTLGSFVVFLWLLGFSETRAFFQAPARAWEFSAGGLVSFVPISWLNRNKIPCQWAGIAGLLALIASAAVFTASEKFPAYLAAIAVVASAAVLVAGAATSNSPTTGLLKLAPFQYLGRISYSLYLWHWPVITIAKEALSNDSLTLDAACIVGSILLAVLTYAFVEIPIRNHTAYVSRPRASLAMAAVSMTICMIGFAAWRAVLVHSEQYRKFQNVIEDVPSLYALGCGTQGIPRFCSFGETSKPVRTVVLYGDSHTAQWFQPLKEIAEAQHWKLVTMIKVGCSPMRIESDRRENPQENEICVLWRDLAVAKMRELQPDMIILSSSSRYPPPGNPTGVIRVSEWEQKSRETFLSLSHAATRVIFIRDTPHFDYNVPSCLAQREWNGRARCYPSPRLNALEHNIYDAEVRAGAGIANVRFIDMSDAILDGDRLELERKGLVLFMDDDHLTQSFAGSLRGALQKQLTGASD